MFKLIKSLFKPKTDVARLLREGAVIVDVRTRGEFQAGHLPGSRNIPLNTLKDDINALKKLNKPIVTVCQSGNRSGVARSMLASAGVEAYNGGGWISLKKQLQTP